MTGLFYKMNHHKEKSMKFVIEHLAKHFEQKEVLRDISFTFQV